MFYQLFRCIACQTSANSKSDWSFFPLCQICKGYLKDCPSLCPQCASPVCPQNTHQQCLRPWIQFTDIHSYSSRYLLTSLGYPVLKAWKVRRGLWFDRQIFQPQPELLRVWREFAPEVIIPVPQRFHREWSLGGSRPGIISHWVAHHLQVPVKFFLEFERSHPPTLRQAQLNLRERLQSQRRFQFQPQAGPICKKAILVDDFMTTGHTVRQAASALIRAGFGEIHVFCLGIRAPQLHT